MAKSKPEPAEEAETDYTAYVDKEATSLQRRFADWLLDKTGYNPATAKTKDEVFREAVKLAVYLRIPFQGSPENKRDSEAERLEREEAKAAAAEEREALKAAKAEEKAAAEEAKAAARAERAEAKAAKGSKAEEKATEKPAKAAKAAPAKAAPAKATPAKAAGTRRRRNVDAVF